MNNLNFGIILKDWRTKRKMSQMELAHVAGISTKHLSFLETAKSYPSRDMVDILGTALNIPLREKNDLMTAAGFSVSYKISDLNDPSMWAARETIQKLISAHMPYPALAVDRHWNLVTANESAMSLMKSVEPSLLNSPINVLRVSLHPEGLASKIVNFHQWKRHLIHKLDHDFIRSQDPVLFELKNELMGYVEPNATSEDSQSFHNIAVPLVLNLDGKELTFISTITIFGSPNDVTLSEMALETFFPADEQTKKYFL